MVAHGAHAACARSLKVSAAADNALACCPLSLAHSLYGNSIGDQGAEHFAGALKINTTLQTLKYAASTQSNLAVRP